MKNSRRKITVTFKAKFTIEALKEHNNLGELLGINKSVLYYTPAEDDPEEKHLVDIQKA